MVLILLLIGVTADVGVLVVGAQPHRQSVSKFNSATLRMVIVFKAFISLISLISLILGNNLFYCGIAGQVLLMNSIQ